ncbi:MAG: hypothetical protein HC902_02800 [Calothrix sp. SM1_5_4]|nr:hypothetical protein [Calothrix sp. SM1_5_4]
MKHLLVLTAIAFWLSPASVRANDLASRLESVIKTHQSIARDQLGVAVYEGPNLVFGVNEQKDFIPASITKIATAAAVLQRLGPSFKFQTTLWSSGTVKEGVLKGDLILKGGGDAGFVSETMWFLVNEFTRTGVRRIEGDLIVDDGDFDAIRADSSRDPERVDRAYDAPVGAMSFNWNSINIFIRPTQVGGAADRLSRSDRQRLQDRQ